MTEDERERMLAKAWETAEQEVARLKERLCGGEPSYWEVELKTSPDDWWEESWVIVGSNFTEKHKAHRLADAKRSNCPGEVYRVVAVYITETRLPEMPDAVDHP